MCRTPARPSRGDLLIQPLIWTWQGPKKELGRVSHFPHRDYGGSPSGRTDVSTLPLSRGEKTGQPGRVSARSGPGQGPRRSYPEETLWVFDPQ